MALFDNLFKRKRTGRTIEDIPLDDLQTEKYALEEKQRRCDEEHGKLDARKKQLFMKGAAPDVSNMERRMIGSQMVELDERMKDSYTKFHVHSLKLQAVGRFITVKEKKTELEADGLWTVLSEMPQAELEHWAVYNSVKDRKLMDSLSRVNEILGQPQQVAFQEVNERVNAYVKALETVAETGAADEEWERVRRLTDPSTESPESA